MADGYISQLKLPDKKVYDLKVKSNNITPAIHKTWAGNSYYATAANQATSTWMFMSIKPESWYKSCTVRFKIRSFCPGHTNCDSTTYCTITYRANSYVVSCWNDRYDHAHYYIATRLLTSTGFNAGLGHALGISILYSNNYTNSSWPRTFELDYYDCDACEVTILENPVLWSNWTNGTDTNYGGWNNANAVDRGLQESGDANSYDLLQMSNSYLTNGSILRFPPYTIFGLDKNGNAQAFSLYQANYESSTTSINQNRVYNTAGIDWTRGIFYYSGGSNYATNVQLSISVRSAASAFDIRYSDNAVASTGAANTLGLISKKPIYIRGTIGDDGLFYLAPLDITYNNLTYKRVWTQDIPTENSNYVYWFLGYPYYNSTYANSLYQADLYENNPLYWYHNGLFQEYIPHAIDSDTVNGLTVQTAVPENAVFTDHYAWGDITGKPTSIALTGAVTANATTLGNGAISIATTVNHGHGDITSDGKLATANRMVWTDANKKLYAGYHYVNSTKLAINSSSEPSYNLYINGNAELTGPLRVTSTSGAKYLLMGNQDSSGANCPVIFEGVNGSLYIGNGTSWTGTGGTLTTGIFMSKERKVGIGTTSPSTALHVNGEITISRSSTTSQNYPAKIIFSTTDSDKSISSSSFIAVYNDHATTYNSNMVISSGGGTFIGGGESAANIYSALGSTTSTENLYLSADSLLFAYAYADTAANRIGFKIDTSGNVVPQKAEAVNSNAQTLGASGNVWKAVYATDFYGSGSNITLGTASVAVVTDANKKLSTQDLSVTDSNASTNATTTFVQAVTQSATGKISVTKASLNTSGTWSGTASKVTTTANTSDSLYLVGVKSGATSTLLHDSSITVTDSMLATDGIIKTGRYFHNVASFGCTNTPKEILIKTKIPFTNGTTMPKIILHIYNYATGLPTEIGIVFYIYNGAFCNMGVTSNTKHRPKVTLCTYTESDTKYVAIGLGLSDVTADNLPDAYYIHFNVDFIDIWPNSNTRISHAKGWTITGNTSTTSIIPTDDRQNPSYVDQAQTAKQAAFTSNQWGISYYSDTAGTFASTGAGTSGQYLKSNGSSAPTWATFGPATVGLGNVENTKLSTWTGSSNISTVGTITSGTWKGTKIANDYIANPKVTIAGNDVNLGGSLAASTLTSSLGLSNALHFIGITSTELSDGSTTSTLTAKSTNSLSKTTGFVDGDVVMDGDQLREYVWVGTAWRLLGITTSTAYSQTATGNSWITSITQGTDGKITATIGTLDTTGTWSGKAGSLTDLGTSDAASSTNTARYVWFAYNDNKTGRPAYSSALTFQTSTGNLSSTKFNNLTLTAATQGFTIAGGSTTSKTLTVSENITLQGGSASKLAWYSSNNTISGARNAYLIDESGTSVANKRNELVLGNATGKATNGSSFGRLALYSPGTTGTYLVSAESSNGWFTATLQAKTGTIAYTSDIEALDVSNITGFGAGKTLKTLTETDGKIAATFQDISITKSQISDFAHTHYELATIGDKRNDNTTPNTYANRLIFQGLKYNNKINSPYTDNYSYLVGLRGWSDSSGGNSHELAFNGNGIYRRQGATDTWGNWFHILDSNNTSSGTNNAATLTWSTTYIIAKINGTDIKFTTMSKPSYAFTDLTSHPTTLSGYGITDAMSSSTTVTNVSYTSASDNASYPILMKNTTGSTTTAAGVKFNTGVTINPSESSIAATAFTGKLITTRITQPALSGSGTTATDAGASNADTRYRPAVWTFNASITPTDGDVVNIKQPCAGHDYGTWLTLDNGTTYYPVVYCSSSRITTHFANGQAIKLYFDAAGTASVYARGGSAARSTITGVWRVMTMYDSNSNDTGYYHRRIYPNLKAGGVIHPYTIIMQLANGKWSGITTTAPNNPGKSNVSPVATGKTASTSGYLLGHVLLMYANTTYADTNNIGTYNIWSAHTGLIDARYSFNLANSSGNGFTAYTPVYIVGTVTNGLFYLDTTKWWTQTLPTTDDGKVYIYIGDAYDWYRITFTEDKPIYWYKNGAIRLYTDTYAASDDGSVISVARNTETTLATINGKTIKIKIPASDNTWRPIGTGASDAMAGNTNVNNVSQGTTTTANWRKILLSGQDYAAYNTAVGNDQNTVTYRAVGVSVQPSTGSMRISGTFTSNHLYTNTNATYDIGATATRWRNAYLSTALLVGAASTITAYNSNALGSFIGPGVISSCVTSAGNGYYVIGQGVQYAHMYISTIGKAGTETTFTNPDDSSQTVTGYTGNTTGVVYLMLGNDKAVGSNGTKYSSPGTAGTANNAQGYLRLYSSSSSYGEMTAYGSWAYPNTGLAIRENALGIMFRPGSSSYYTHISYQTSGNEALVAATTNAVTSFIFVNGEAQGNIASDRWTKLTGASGAGNAPGLQIKQNCVSIGELIPSGTNATYKLNVNGTSNFKGNMTSTGSFYTSGRHISLISGGENDQFIDFAYAADPTASTAPGASWRIGALNSGSGDSNYFVIQTGGSGTSSTTWNNALRFGMNTYDAGFGGNVYPLTNNNKTLGTSSLKWNAVYATTYYGALEQRDSTSSVARPVWFSYSSNGTSADAGVLGRDTEFTYNPSTNVLVVGKLTITGGTTNSTIASSGTLDIANAAKALTVSTTTAALTISTGNGALEAKSTGTGTVKLTSNSGAMTLSTTSGNMSLSSGGTISISSGSSKALTISAGSTASISATTTMTISSTTSTSISATTTMSISGTQGTTINSGSGYATVFKINNTEYGRFNTSGMFQLNDSGTQNTHKLYVNGDSAFHGKMAFGNQTSNTITEFAYMQWNDTDKSIDFIFA